MFDEINRDILEVSFKIVAIFTLYGFSKYEYLLGKAVNIP
jgi:hypothetical protein